MHTPAPSVSGATVPLGSWWLYWTWIADAMAAWTAPPGEPGRRHWSLREARRLVFWRWQARRHGAHANRRIPGTGVPVGPGI